MKLCHCGKPLHYSDSRTQGLIQSFVTMYGDTVNITMNGRTWAVPRHYLALHGVKSDEIAKLGFKEVTRELRNKK